jgi:phospholipase/lecithinase/hemolysin
MPMKHSVQLIIGILLFGLGVLPTQAAFTSLYVFGDALSATADGTGTGLYYQNRDSNGRVWVEVLAQRQGLTFDGSKNDSYYDHNSIETLADINKFKAPPDVASALFVVWVCNADTFDSTSVAINSPIQIHALLLTQFIASNTLDQVNNLQIITALYAKGVRTLIMPNVVDISEIPAYNAGNMTDVLRAGCNNYDAQLATTISTAKTLCPGLAIYTPDFYTLLNNTLTNAAYYGLTNALSANGFSIDAVDALYPNPKLPVYLNGPGTNYIFWDYMNPTAKLHEIMADTVQQIISPVQIGKLAVLNNGSNRLDVINYPAGLNGSVDGSTNLALGNWTSVTNINISSGNTAQSFFVIAPQLPPPVPASGTGGSTDPNNPANGTYTPPFNPAQFYRLDFPFAWSWP